MPARVLFVHFVRGKFNFRFGGKINQMRKGFRRLKSSIFWVCNWACLGLQLGLIGFVLGSFWVRFGGVKRVVNFHNPLLIQRLRSFEEPANWVRFA